ncbi:MAG: hypothetical protein FWG90_08350 [Oscillospiraceae bacterium]|nr:hypothetical protein [Oscillospiraceae bacterium]
MGDCKDYWCEHYGSGKCDNCVKNQSAEDMPELRVILKKRSLEQMEIFADKSNNKGLER